MTSTKEDIKDCKGCKESAEWFRQGQKNVGCSTHGEMDARRAFDILGFSEESKQLMYDFAQRLAQKLSTPEYIEGSKTAFSFDVNKRQAEKILNFTTEHNRTCRFANPGSCGASGGRFTYEFCNTYLGQVCKFKCECGASIDVTDYEEW